MNLVQKSSKRRIKSILFKSMYFLIRSDRNNEMFVEIMKYEICINKRSLYVN